MTSRRDFLKNCLYTGIISFVIPREAIKWSFNRLPTPQEILANPLGVYLPNHEQQQIDIIENLLCHMMLKIKEPNIQDMNNSSLYLSRNHVVVSVYFMKCIIYSESKWRRFLIPIFNKNKDLRERFILQWKETSNDLPIRQNSTYYNENCRDEK